MHKYLIGYTAFTACWLFGVLLWQLNWACKDAPAWVQAVGSVAAIVAAIGIAVWQTSKVRSEARSEKLTKQLVIMESIAVFANNFEWAASFTHALATQVFLGDRTAGRSNEGTFDDTEHALRQIPLYEMANAEQVRVVADFLVLISALRKLRSQLMVVEKLPMTAASDLHIEAISILESARSQKKKINEILTALR